MEDILYQLFTNEYNVTPQRDKKQQELRNQLFAELDKVGAVFGQAFLDHLLELDLEWTVQQDFLHYRSGFALGIRLMLEALR